MRTVKNIYQAPFIMMGDIKLKQAIPIRGLEQISPFILLHHFDFEMEAGNNNFNVPPHPHRGFCPITFMYNGSVNHNDSLGNNHVVHADEVQWINAARGIIHSETTDKEFIKTGGRFQGIQLWINLKSEDKMKTPSYQAITKNEIVLIENEGVECRLVSGKFMGKIGPANYSEVITAMLKIKANHSFEFELPIEHNAIVYVLEGKLQINDSDLIERYSLVHFNQEEGVIKLSASEDAKLLIMSGNEIHEKLVTHGPFVMNSETEIMEAMRDYQNGKMGFLY